jgi:hypothetical protein
MKIGYKPLTMNIFPSDAESAMNMGIYSENAPSMRPPKEGNPEDGKDKDGFAQPGGKRRQAGRRQQNQVSKDPSTRNKFAILQDQPEDPATNITPKELPVDNTSSSKEQEEDRQPQGKKADQDPQSTAENLKDALQLEDGDAEMETEEQDLAGVDLEHLEHAYRQQKLYTIPRDQLRKVHKIFINSSAGSSAIQQEPRDTGQSNEESGEKPERRQETR